MKFAKQWTPEEEKKLVEVMSKSEGKSWKEIAVHFPHRSPDAVRNKFKKMSETDKVAKSFWAATISKQQARAAAGSVNTPMAASESPAIEEEAPSLMTEKDPMEGKLESKVESQFIEEGILKPDMEEEEQQEQKGEKKELTPEELAQEEDDRRRKLWTTEEDDQLKQLIRKHKPQTNEDWEQIALKLGRTIKSVKHKYNDHNLKYLLNS